MSDLQPPQPKLDSLVYIPGGDWPEARSFTRTYAGNPHAQLRLVRALAGLHAIAKEGWRPNSNTSNGQMGSEEAEAAIKGTIRFLREQFPEWASRTPIILDSDFWEETYPGCDEHTRHFIEQVILGGEFGAGDVSDADET